MGMFAAFVLALLSTSKDSPRTPSSHTHTSVYSCPFLSLLPLSVPWISSYAVHSLKSSDSFLKLARIRGLFFLLFVFVSPGISFSFFLSLFFIFHVLPLQNGCHGYEIPVFLKLSYERAEHTHLFSCSVLKCLSSAFSSESCENKFPIREKYGVLIFRHSPIVNSLLRHIHPVMRLLLPEQETCSSWGKASSAVAVSRYCR